MDTKQRITEKFNRLLSEGQEIFARNGWDGKEWHASFPSEVEYLRWRTEALNLLKKVCGEGSEHYGELKDIAVKQGTNGFYFNACYGIVEAAKRDYDDDFLSEIRLLVRAELLNDFISQAEALFADGYHIPAASLAGGVLEDTLRKLCDKHSISYPEKTKIDSLNSALAKENVYDKLIQKEITAKADLRNNADHGHFDKVRQADVEDMVRWIRRFATDHLK